MGIAIQFDGALQPVQHYHGERELNKENQRIQWLGKSHAIMK